MDIEGILSEGLPLPQRPITVPLTRNGDVVGTATVFPDGKIVATIDATERGRAIRELIEAGQVRDISINPIPPQYKRYKKGQ